MSSQLRLVDSPPAPAPIAYTTVLADPAWRYGDLLRQSKVKRSSVDQYELTMSVGEIGALGRGPVAVNAGGGNYITAYTIAGIPTTSVGFLCLWAPAAFVLDGSATEVARSWGYEPKQLIPWIKGRPRLKLATDGGPNVYDVDIMVQMGMGRIFRGCSEFLVICARGDGYTKLVKHRGTNGLIFEDDEIIIAPRPTSETRGVEHSTKPREQYALIERVLPGPYLELFACEKREGWTSVGSVFGQLMTPHAVVPYAPEGLVLPDPGLEWDF